MMFLELLQYSFIQKALIAGILVAFASPIIGIDDNTGTSNVLKGTILGGVVLNGISIVYA